ncbi:hypothetical protein F0562_015555 [Nyssa sinensis]|uniref:Disease resistance N-terminal domain-containing protein n=1 Tax=Nyssa sinensis TaxID=561372 RepID=A0A5J4ZLX9_9ASTE|nr:hypothetical protein F0562_015555 [Nyssa sinensis]
MADTFLFGIVREITQKLASLAADEVALAWGLEEELRRLEDTATTIEAVLLDAEEQQVRSRAVREWLRRLQDVVRDITNVVDDIATEALRRQVENQITDKVVDIWNLCQTACKTSQSLRIWNFRYALGSAFQRTI